MVWRGWGRRGEVRRGWCWRGGWREVRRGVVRCGEAGAVSRVWTGEDLARLGGVAFGAAGVRRVEAWSCLVRRVVVWRGAADMVRRGEHWRGESRRGTARNGSAGGVSWGRACHGRVWCGLVRLVAWRVVARGKARSAMVGFSAAGRARFDWCGKSWRGKAASGLVRLVA